MSFIRPEAMAFLRRWSETLGVGVITIGLVYGGVQAGLNNGWLGWLAAALCLAGGGLLTKNAWERALLSEDGQQRVYAEEGRIRYIGPYGETRIELDDLERVELALAGSGPSWMLSPDFGPPVNIPLTADPDLAALDALSTLPGFSQEQALKALSGQAGKLALVWRR